ncbi:MAG: helix-turn-helix domain-containing protein [Staphylococcus equorum]|uniref:helix-turn-helix transcriptional regulator n=1 Tax=Staphylococcus TaxID=1279 RepID=UPI002552DA1E|nr:helix-turn-helix transcriptional regulator [Staphylococcus equorum]MDN5832168.1 helix-turn-helix domain-containing protein [Tetragenococcus halophilus]MDK9871992.1 helix-turn-helix transcriptional regulator [Staphylococcus equorum]MDK9876900.1 helix-turn-helix transcriptional regulator [Staphylococcus equorum]MDN6569757.1 helix-turn-helix domain-containing protein [Staphylococcus equorum]MDN6610635.1 helix-turn-helix domain-containing protein [Staphylococcus equorum]
MNNMKELRINKNLKQKELARITGLSTAAISLFENNKTTPSMNSAYKIAKALDVSLENLFPLKVEIYLKKEETK